MLFLEIHQSLVLKLFNWLLCFTINQSLRDIWKEQKQIKISPEMTNNDLGKEVTDAWAEFTKDAEKAKEAILSAFTDDATIETENNVEGVMLFSGIMGFLALLLVTFLVYSIFNLLNKKKKDWIKAKSRKFPP